MKKVLLTIAIVAAGATMVLDAEQPVEPTTPTTETTAAVVATPKIDTILIQRQGQAPDTIYKVGVNNTPGTFRGE